MGNIALVVLVLSLVVAAPVAQGKFEEVSQMENWNESLELGKEKMTKLHFYFHDTLSGERPSAVRVAQGPDSEKSPTGFGVLMMADDALTEGPEPTSKLVGRAQGLYGSAGQDSLGLIMAMSFGFTEGVYNGSTLSIFGRNPAMNPVRELPIVGGTGIFQLARGTALAKTYWFNATTGDAIVEYNVTVFH
ncbi:Plant disease resistance response protein [Macleaya cordata]|uniref:Dirigent protein n=1 Tax=Macleaya cordata TaxID=56857 RepID=A0A200RA99_MACCD|nr:Plant disease resistance response protein [Macleaya cordata]